MNNYHSSDSQKPPLDPKEWTAQEMQALDRFMKALRETRSALVALDDVGVTEPMSAATMADQLIAMRDLLWPQYQEMTLQNLRRQVY